MVVNGTAQLYTLSKIRS